MNTRVIQATPISDPAVERAEVVRYSREGSAAARMDWISVEAPLEIRLTGEAVATTMRTPGHDEELVVGYLFAEGVIGHRGDVGGISRCGPGGPSAVIDVSPAPGTAFDVEPRLSMTSSACGLCGRQHLGERLGLRSALCPRGALRAAVVYRLVENLRAQQTSFEHTGGLHAAGLGYPDGTFSQVREDIGRHNAVDKVIGRAVLDDTTPCSEQILVVSSRASFEIVDKAWRAGIATVVAVSAPSSLAIEAARRANITLVGFARGERFNVYTHPARILP